MVETLYDVHKEDSDGLYKLHDRLHQFSADSPPTPTDMVFKVLLNQHKQAFGDGNTNMWECADGAGEENVGGQRRLQ